MAFCHTPWTKPQRATGSTKPRRWRWRRQRPRKRPRKRPRRKPRRRPWQRTTRRRSTRSTPPGGDEPGGSDPGDDDEPHNKDPDHHPEDDENENESPPPRRSKAPSGYNWDQLNSTVWRDGSSRAKTPGAGISEGRNNAFCECLHEAIQDATRDMLRRTPVTAGTYVYLKTVAAGTPLPIYDGEDDLQVFMPWIHCLM